MWKSPIAAHRGLQVNVEVESSAADRHLQRLAAQQISPSKRFNQFLSLRLTNEPTDYRRV